MCFFVYLQLVGYLPPFTVYKGLHLYDTWTKGGPPGALYSGTESGWMMDCVFEAWMDFFITFTKDIPKPILLLFDGHGSHLTYCSVKRAMDNNIIILCLPPNTSHALQPLDVGVFAPLKKSWKNVLKTWYRESRQQKVSKATFPYLLKNLFASVKAEHAVKGCQGCGLLPINKEKVIRRILATEKGSSDNIQASAAPITTPAAVSTTSTSSSTIFAGPSTSSGPSATSAGEL
ncbi:hypothetical protein JTE90_008643 [Oedothorax gibbosus]|uniref:DDE-1 domain-containing protein n=1 Tax=Oedothorax gibbosus TaxID=931172 RepID=A0AAV6U1L5_9ARAC|nr:hypothetical protein JTE90_008643 [Oedothorax gibbosus]